MVRLTRSIDFDPGALPREVVDDVEQPKRLTLLELVRHEVHRPSLVGSRGPGNLFARRRRHLLASPPANSQAFFAVEPIHALAVHREAFLAQCPVQEAIAPARPPRGPRMQPQTQILVLASLARIPAGRPVQADQPARLALELRGAKRTVFAPPGIDTSLFCPPEPDRPRQSLLSVGRLGDPRKGFRKLFRAYAALRKQRPDSPRLVVAGTGALPAAEQEFLRTNELAEWVDVRRDVTKQELVRLYQQASLFVLASDEEGFGFVLIEAMACATPVVSTASGGPNLIVDDGVTGLLVPVGEPTALVAGMKQCLDDPALARRLGEAGRTRAVEVYSQEAAAERIFVEYDRLLCGA